MAYTFPLGPTSLQNSGISAPFSTPTLTIISPVFGVYLKKNKSKSE